MRLPLRYTRKIQKLKKKNKNASWTNMSSYESLKYRDLQRLCKSKGLKGKWVCFVKRSRFLYRCIFFRVRVKFNRHVTLEHDDVFLSKRILKTHTYTWKIIVMSHLNMIHNTYTHNIVFFCIFFRVRVKNNHHVTLEHDDVFLSKRILKIHTYTHNILFFCLSRPREK